MRKLYFIIIALFLIPLFVSATDARYEGDYFCGYITLMDSLGDHDTLSTDGSATDSAVFYTTEFGQFSDSLYFSIKLLATETGAQVGNVDIDLAFSPDSSSGFSAQTEILANLDVGANTDDQWYEVGIGTAVDQLYTMKWVKVVVQNTDADANEVILKDIGIAHKKRIKHY